MDKTDAEIAQAGEDALEHFGVRGMHWGQRKAPKPGMSTTYHKGKVIKETPIKGAYPKTAAERKAFVEKQAATAQQKANAKQSAKNAGKIALQVGARGAGIAGLVALGVPALAAGVSIAVVAAASPELLSAGKSYAKLAMDEIGIHNMSTLDNLKERTNIQGQGLKYKARGGD